MNFENLDESNFILYAARHYDNPQCTDTEEFVEDLKKFRYIKKLFYKFKNGGELKERLVLNHIIILYNVFGIPATTRMLFCKLIGYHDYLKTFLVFLNYMPDIVDGIHGKNILSSDIKMSKEIIEILRQINNS